MSFSAPRQDVAPQGPQKRGRVSPTLAPITSGGKEGYGAHFSITLLILIHILNKGGKKRKYF